MSRAPPYGAVLAACRAADDALLTPDGLEPFTRAVEEGLSVNLCEALVGLGGAAGHPFEPRARTPEEGVVVTGEVVRSHCEPARPERSDRDYKLAVRAHQQMRWVTVAGNLVRRGTRYVLTSPCGFRIVQTG